ncbi:DUF294 nucleotidyltransferase-like domain-containing protein [Alicyclobacillus tolerans]|uniref:putative nucleotidyltransferase substrate binding domain-containing protein n=1 Tax=Alicyclobacillus tolerans TaxID=90970 RepID=UPI001F01D6E6|nr:putative nucleotidyltransferase substrate binding domain-containing protein [Alicyclobacillus tolerans]MCF8563172.1 DUF294 nucleotidyltransferase-like domain-containing protein [Alicyclobacillus tolerans]
MSIFPFFDPDWLKDTDAVSSSELWRASVLQSVEAWLSSSQDPSLWMSQFTQIRRRIIQIVWEHVIPSSVREQMEYVVLGSGSRDEDTLYSDLDHAVFLNDHLGPDEVAPYLSRLISRLNSFGFPVCQGFVMSTNTRWIGTALDWHNRIESYFQYPDWENSRYLFILLDGKPLSGESPTWSRVFSQVFHGIRNSSFICWEMAHLGIHRTVAMNVFGRIRTVSRESGDAVNVKDGLLNPIVRSLRLIAVAEGCQEPSTLFRVSWLEKKGVFSHSWAQRIESALQFGWRLRLIQQMDDLKNGRIGSEFIHLAQLEPGLKEQLTVHLDTAKQLERWTHRRFPKPR